jgi:hypothetical protein
MLVLKIIATKIMLFFILFGTACSQSGNLVDNKTAMQNTSMSNNSSSNNQAEEVLWTGKKDKFEIKITTKDMYIEGNGLFSDYTNKVMENYLRKNKPLKNCKQMFFIKPMSIVGNIVSFEQTTILNCEPVSGNSVSRKVNWATIDLSKDGVIEFLLDDYQFVNSKNTKLVQLTQIFPAEEIKEKLGALKLKIGDINEHAFTFDKLQNEKVLVNVTLKKSENLNEPNINSIELLLKIPAKYNHVILNADAKKDGFLKKDVDSILKNDILFEIPYF